MQLMVTNSSLVWQLLMIDILPTCISFSILLFIVSIEGFQSNSWSESNGVLLNIRIYIQPAILP
jgi:hypothetical protein